MSYQEMEVRTRHPFPVLCQDRASQSIRDNFSPSELARWLSLMSDTGNCVDILPCLSPIYRRISRITSYQRAFLGFLSFRFRWEDFVLSPWLSGHSHRHYNTRTSLGEGQLILPQRVEALIARNTNTSRSATGLVRLRAVCFQSGHNRIRHLGSRSS